MTASNSGGFLAFQLTLAFVAVPCRPTAAPNRGFYKQLKQFSKSLGILQPPDLDETFDGGVGVDAPVAPKLLEAVEEEKKKKERELEREERERKARRNNEHERNPREGPRDRDADRRDSRKRSYDERTPVKEQSNGRDSVQHSAVGPRYRQQQPGEVAPQLVTNKILFDVPSWAAAPKFSGWRLEVQKNDERIAIVSVGQLPAYVFGRDPDCHVRLDHASVSRRHAVLVHDKRGDGQVCNETFIYSERELDLSIPHDVEKNSRATVLHCCRSIC